MRLLAASCSIWLRSTADRKSTRLNSSHGYISYAVFCLKKKTIDEPRRVDGRRARVPTRGRLRRRNGRRAQLAVGRRVGSAVVRAADSRSGAVVLETDPP